MQPLMPSSGSSASIGAGRLLVHIERMMTQEERALKADAADAWKAFEEGVWGVKPKLTGSDSSTALRSHAEGIARFAGSVITGSVTFSSILPVYPEHLDKTPHARGKKVVGGP